MSIGVSRYCRSQALAWRAYEQSFQALSGSFAVGYAQVLRPQEKKAAENVVRQNEVAAIAKRFSVAISAGRPELCQKYVDHLFQRLSIIMADENYIRSYVVLVLSEVMQYCIRLGMDANDLSQRLVIMIQQVFQAGTIAKLQESTTEFLKRMIQQDNGRERFSRNRMNIAHAVLCRGHLTWRHGQAVRMQRGIFLSAVQKDLWKDLHRPAVPVPHGTGQGAAGGGRRQQHLRHCGGGGLPQLQPLLRLLPQGHRTDAQRIPQG